MDRDLWSCIDVIVYIAVDLSVIIGIPRAIVGYFLWCVVQELRYRGSSSVLITKSVQ